MHLVELAATTRRAGGIMVGIVEGPGVGEPVTGAKFERVVRVKMKLNVWREAEVAALWFVRT